MARPRYEYRVAQVNDKYPYNETRLWFHYQSLKAARSRVKQVAGIPHVRVMEIQRREVGPWKHLEKGPHA